MSDHATKQCPRCHGTGVDPKPDALTGEARYCQECHDSFGNEITNSGGELEPDGETE